MLDQMSVLVTGARGYIGRHVIKQLLDHNMKVSVVDRNIGDIDPRVQTFEMDIFDDNQDVYEDLGCPDIVLHLAWKDGFIHNADTHVKYLYSHFRFLKNLVDGGLKHLVVMGTMHEIGYFEGEVCEDTPTNPYSLYGVAKNSLRQALEVYLSDKNVVFQWLRAFYIYGDDTKNKSVFAKIYQAEMEGKESFPFTSGENKYDFIDVDDLAKQITLCALQTEVKGIINCCSGQPVALREMVEGFIIKNKLKIKLDYGSFPDRPYDSPAIWGNNNKILKIISQYDVVSSGTHNK